MRCGAKKIATGAVAEKLKRQLSYTLGESRFYQNKLAGISYSGTEGLERFDEIPFTTKNEVLEDQRREPPFGTNLCVDTAKVQRVHKTSGSTDRPLFVALSRNDVRLTVKIGSECFAASGLRAADTVVHCLNYQMWAGGYTDHQSLEATGAAVIPFGVGNSRNLIETMLQIRPTAIHCTPSYLAKLELIAREEFKMTPSELGLRLGLFGGESGFQNPDFRRHIEKTWGLKAMNANYGVSEVLSMSASESVKQDGLCFRAAEALFAELIGGGDAPTVLPIEEGVQGELVLTHLCKEAQPLIRYRTNDIIKILAVDKSRDRGSFRFEVVGRSDDMIVVKGINLFINNLDTVIKKHLDVLTGVFHIFVNQSDPIGRILLKIERRDISGFADGAVKALLTQEFKDHCSVKPEIDFLPPGSLPRTEGKSKRLFRTL